MAHPLGNTDELQKAWTGGTHEPPVVRGLYAGCDYRNSATLPDGNSLDAKGFFGSDTLELYTNSLLYQNQPSNNAWVQDKYASALIEDGQIPDEKEFSKVALDIINNRPAHLRGRPTKTNILAQLGVLASVSRPGDVAYFHFCGHGHGGPKTYAARVLAMVGKTSESFLVCSSDDVADPNNVQMISRSELNAALAKLQKGRPDRRNARRVLQSGYDRRPWPPHHCYQLRRVDFSGDHTDAKTPPPRDRTYVVNQKVLQSMCDQFGTRVKAGKIEVVIRDPEGIKGRKWLETGQTDRVIRV
ncbi:hypothetical protein P7C71_g6303, partial [Lecanoromycetidae sp. Uapishka_2]